jgi:hypothetical protein
MPACRSRRFSDGSGITTSAQTSKYLAASPGGDADEMRAFEQRIGRIQAAESPAGGEAAPGTSHSRVTGQDEESREAQTIH